MAENRYPPEERAKLVAMLAAMRQQVAEAESALAALDGRAEFPPPPNAREGEGPVPIERLREVMADSDAVLPWEVEWMAAELLHLKGEAAPLKEDDNG